MKILLVSPTYSAGGAERCARELFLQLRERGAQTEMWVGARRPDDPDGVRLIRVPGEHWLLPLDWALHHTDWRHIGSRWRLGRIGRGDFDVVHFHNIHGNWLSIRAMHDLCRRVPVVWTLHDEWAATGGIIYDLSQLLSEDEIRHLPHDRTLPYHTTLGVARLRRFLARWMPQPAAIVTPSQYLGRLVEKSGRFPGVPVHYIPNGLTLLDRPMPSQADARAKFGVPREGSVVLMVAADLSVAYKGIDLGLQVLRAIPPAARPTVLLLGRNAEPLVQRLQDFRVVTAFAADAASLAAAYRAADVTLVPSRGDNLPFIVLEAFACRTPVAAFAVGGIVEMLADGRGLLAKPFDILALRDHVLELLKNASHAAGIAEAAHAWVARECSMPTYLDRVMAVYEDVSGRARKAVAR